MIIKRIQKVKMIYINELITKKNPKLNTFYKVYTLKINKKLSRKQ